ncbi:hypothetical protein ABS71_10480 [bacterium SCN 62-11]|nr:MAG: hypothetical protein ABS71_10480 [bacterium SCN 62-11]
MTNLREARERSGLTLVEAAKKLGISVATLRGLEDRCFVPKPTETEAVRRLYGAALTEPEQLDLFRSDL